MKKCFAVWLVGTMLLGLTACGGAAGSEGGKQENDTASNEVQAYLDSITEDTAQFKGICGPDAMWFYKDNVMVVKGTGPMTDPTWNTEKLADEGMSIHLVVVDEGITAPNFHEEASWNIPLTTKYLAKIFLPSTLEAIPDYAFSPCQALTEITIPDSVTSIGYESFCCESLTSLTIPDSVTSIGDRAFVSSGLTDITISNSVTSIGEETFMNCQSLTSVTIPNSVTSIGDHAFAYCSSLASVTIPDSVTDIWVSAFRECRGLTDITIPDSVTTIRASTFLDCNSLANVTIPDSVTTIEKFAFRRCENLTSITIPDSVTTIEDGAFAECTNLTEIHYSGPAAGYPWGAPNL